MTAPWSLWDIQMQPKTFRLGNIASLVIIMAGWHLMSVYSRRQSVNDCIYMFKETLLDKIMQRYKAI